MWCHHCSTCSSLQTRTYVPHMHDQFAHCLHMLDCDHAASIAPGATGGCNFVAGTAAIFFIFAYSPCYSIGYNALTYTYLVELWPFAERSRGIAWFQPFRRLTGFFTTFVNPIGLQNISWKWLITYCCWLVFEICFVWFLFPETTDRTLEELAFCKAFFNSRHQPEYPSIFTYFLKLLLKSKAD
jgi:hypothetical protein